MNSFLDTIVEDRKKSIAERGYSQGIDIPQDRPLHLPLINFICPRPNQPLIICEIKKQSPSRGPIATAIRPTEQAKLYVQEGIASVSVLTEENHFCGSLQDLMDVKSAFPELAVLRKDFLLSEDDILLSYRAGADAVLLITSILEVEQMRKMYNLCQKLGLCVLLETHSRQDIAKLRYSGLAPSLIGVNARDLRSFQVDLLAALSLAEEIDWECTKVFESGIFFPEQVALAVQRRSTAKKQGFSGLLIGEAALRYPERIASFKQAMQMPETFPAAGVDFWAKILQLKSVRLSSVYPRRQDAVQTAEERQVDQLGYVRPLVKICGICQEADARLIAELGADVLGFVFAKSLRRADIDLLRKLADLDILKVAVITEPPSPELRSAYEEGLIHSFQYHGSENSDECRRRSLPYYKALRLKQASDTSKILQFSSPRVLIDAWSDKAEGGTGERVAKEIVESASAISPLWLAGGINEENLESIILQYRPELLDLSSGVESTPGKKDHQKIRRFFEKLDYLFPKGTSG